MSAQPSEVTASEVTAVVLGALQRLALPSDQRPLNPIEDRVVVHLFRRIEAFRKFVGARPEVMAFALAMERRLAEKDQERGDTWQRTAPMPLSIALCSKAMALDRACLKLPLNERADRTGGYPITGDYAAVLKHAVDVANFALFIAAVTGVLDPEGLGSADLSGGLDGGIPA